ncbi:FHA domain-containing protein [Streptomyces sp. NPDC017991]|uniref:FHA domain-containing protein n=1 Tax=Streptomyces sp. NPDC017991 TaxID=3365026 RepID=UPI0037A9F237
MQIRLTVVDPLGTRPDGRPASCDVLVTAPAGTALAAVASGLASAVGGEGPGVLYAEAERLDAQRCTLGEPPLMDGAVLSLGSPAQPGPDVDPAAAQLRVVAGPDAGGVHLLHGGRIDIGRSADADVPLDDPDVSRLHCAVTVAADGHVSVADLGSTNGTVLDGRRVGERPVPFPPGALLRVGESALLLAPAGEPADILETAPDGEGHVRVVPTAAGAPGRGQSGPGRTGQSGQSSGASGGAGRSTVSGRSGAGHGQRQAQAHGQAQGRIRGEGTNPGDSQGHGQDQGLGRGRRPEQGRNPAISGETAEAGSGASSRSASRSASRSDSGTGGARVPRARDEDSGDARSTGGSRSGVAPPTAETGHGYGTAGWGAAGGGVPGTQEHLPAGPHVVPGQGGAPRIEYGDTGDRVEYGDSGEPYEEDPGPDVQGPGEGKRKGTPLRGTSVPRNARKRGLSAWARRLAGSRSEDQYGDEAEYDPYDSYEAPFAEPVALGVPAPERWPDPAALLLAALGPGPRLWEREPGHQETLTVRLGTADRSTPDGSGLLSAVPVTAGLREVGALGLAGPRERLSGLSRAVVAQLAALHSPDSLEITLLSTDRSRSLEERIAEWSWLGWLPHVRPTHGQDCRLLLAYDREQATARTEELIRRLEDHLTETGRAAERGHGPRVGSGSPDDSGAFAPRPRNPADAGAAPLQDASGAPAPGSRPLGRDANITHLGLPRSGIQAGEARGRAGRPSWARSDDPAETGWSGPHTVVVVDGDPGSAGVREAVSRLAAEGPQVGIHVICLAETPAASPSSPVSDTYEAACAVSPAFRECGAVALLSGDVATALRLLRVAPATQAHGSSGPTDSSGSAGSSGLSGSSGSSVSSGSSGSSGGPVGHGTVATVDAVSMAWAERFARALAPLRAEGGAGERHTRVSAPLPQAARLLDELGLARATPASLMARWADAADDPEAFGGRATAVLGAGPRGPVGVDLVGEGPHLLIEGPPGSGRTELLRSVAASLAAAERPDRLGIVLVDGRDGTGSGGAAARGDGLQVCTDLPHVTTHLGAHDPVRMREFAQSLSAELKRRAELLGRLDFTEWHAGREGPRRVVAQRSAGSVSGAAGAAGAGDIDTTSSSTLRLRPAAARPRPDAGPPLPRLVVVVDDLDALLSPALGSPGRPAAGSVVRALEGVARDGERLGVHLVAATGGGVRTDETELARRAGLRVVLEAPGVGAEEPSPGRGRVGGAGPGGRSVPFQGGRVTGRIPRTATLRPTVVPLEWARMGDPPARRPVRELGNGPTDLALLASALDRAARSVSAAEVPSLL